jgi:hypothetical protein
MYADEQSVITCLYMAISKLSLKSQFTILDFGNFEKMEFAYLYSHTSADTFSAATKVLTQDMRDRQSLERKKTFMHRSGGQSCKT